MELSGYFWKYQPCWNYKLCPFLNNITPNILVISAGNMDTYIYFQLVSCILCGPVFLICRGYWHQTRTEWTYKNPLPYGIWTYLSQLCMLYILMNSIISKTVAFTLYLSVHPCGLSRTILNDRLAISLLYFYSCL